MSMPYSTTLARFWINASLNARLGEAKAWVGFPSLKSHTLVPTPPGNFPLRK